ncbi:hypothetical protein TRFO_39070 [Tritrichomonas foetus]|uniref:Uncharacterized protein n=1 Tax=Tritrichomonas foetus TaxID=1144522 RepID=A0A1J4J664_9EUKA|nr:hypothetical protein TRFO_39070 [Tritrichomonas foetus]|eukprot:OHS94722.1 hypothetical protein TRFO_39070 [Tritrichomonas foetus]
MDHLSQILKCQYEAAKQQFETLQFHPPDSYFIKFRAIQFRIKITENYPVDPPEVYENDSPRPLDLLMIEKWQPYFQLFHLVQHLQSYSRVKRYRLLNFAAIIPEIRENGMAAPSLDDREYFMKNIPSLKAIEIQEKSAKKQIETSQKLAAINIDDMIVETNVSYQQAKNAKISLSEHSRKVCITKKDFIEQEISKIDEKLAENATKLEETIRSMKPNALVERGKAKLVKALLTIKEEEAMLKKKKQVLNSMLE